MMRSRLSLALLVLIGVLITLSLNCHYRSGLFVTDTNPPSFEIRRSPTAHLRIFPLLIVYELHPDNQEVLPAHEHVSKNRILWQIVVDPKQSSAEIKRIDYGKVPPGFIQEIPTEGSPEELQENRMYEARGALSLMGDAAVRFTVKDGKITTNPLP